MKLTSLGILDASSSILKNLQIPASTCTYISQKCKMIKIIFLTFYGHSVYRASFIQKLGIVSKRQRKGELITWKINSK
jgi:hypothetical protein